MQANTYPARYIDDLNTKDQTQTFDSQIIGCTRYTTAYIQVIVENATGMSGVLSLLCSSRPQGPYLPYPYTPPQNFTADGGYAWDITDTGVPYFKVHVEITAGSADFQIDVQLKD